jgi:hypothetical protein
MKRGLLLAVCIGAATCSFAQSQRLELFESFSCENSTVSASVDPAWNSLVNANTNKIATITYQTNTPSAPGFGSLYRQNRGDVRARNAYYHIPHAPYGRFDGQVINSPTDTTMNGSPALMTQNIIDTAYRMSSPFTVVLSHSFHPAYDSVVVTMQITATQAFTTPSVLKAYAAMEEKAIHLNAPTGTNGQKDFYNVMRLMLPYGPIGGGGNPRPSTGYNLPSTWTNGQTQTITMTAAVPTYIYDKGMICFVGFLQDSATYQVEQAAVSAPIPLANSSKAISLRGFSFISCGVTSVTPTVTIQNRGTNTLTSCNINFQLDATTAVIQPWNGNLVTNDSITVTLPAQAITPGAHAFTAWTTVPNGFSELNTLTKQGVNFNIEGTPATAPLIQGFPQDFNNPPVFPPANWILVNASRGFGGGGGGRPGWQLNNNVGDIALGSAVIDFMRSPLNEKDYLYTQNVDLSAATTATLQFNYAHCQARTESDSLVILASSNCGSSWTSVYAKGGPALSTAPNDTTPFAPSAAQWKTEVVNLGSFAGSGHNNVIICFKGVSAGGNALYLDDVNISNSPMGIQENSIVHSLSIYPNPFSDNTTIAFSLSRAENVKLSVSNVLGQTVFSSEHGNLPAGANTLNFNGNNLPAGMYFMNLQTGDKVITRKVTINK